MFSVVARSYKKIQQAKHFVKGTEYRLVLNQETAAAAVLPLPADDATAPEPETAVDGLELARALNRSIMRLYGAHLSEDGTAVDYAALRGDALFAEYKSASAQLRHLSLLHLGQNELKAFCLNLYNALTIHAKAELTSSDAEDTMTFFDRVAYRIGPAVYSLDDIEHGVLRNNSPHPATKLRPFDEAEAVPRLSLGVVQELDPRVHFALVCGARSCPPIRAYSIKNLDRGLDLATRAFCAENVVLDSSTGGVQLSKIFEWYAADFNASKARDTERGVLAWVLPFLEESAQADLRGMLEGDAAIKVKYEEYDWGLNDVAR